MTVLLVRHAAAGDRDGWAAPDEQRPLTPKGDRQARGLVDTLAGYDVGRVLSSPYLRCTQTVAPLAAARGLEVEERDELAEGGGHATRMLVLGLMEGGDAVLRTHGDAVLRTHGDAVLRTQGDVVLCTHGDVVEDVLDALGIDRPGITRKGATWVLDAAGAHHLPPPG